MTNILRINGEDVQLTGSQSGTSKNVVDITDVFIKTNPNLEDSAVWTNFFQNGIDATYEELGFSNKEDFLKNIYNLIFILNQCKLFPEGIEGTKVVCATLAKTNAAIRIEYDRNSSNTEITGQLENLDSILGESVIGNVNLILSGPDFAEEIACTLIYGDTKVKSTV